MKHVYLVLGLIAYGGSLAVSTVRIFCYFELQSFIHFGEAMYAVLQRILLEFLEVWYLNNVLPYW